MTKMLRRVELPATFAGSLYLSSMPGRYGRLENDVAEASAERISRVVCLAPRDEIERKSVEYAHALERGSLPWAIEQYPLPDYGVPDDPQGFATFVKAVAAYLRRGESILIHCGAGVGRTGMTAACILITAGCSYQDALNRIKKAGSIPETPGQSEVVRGFA